MSKRKIQTIQKGWRKRQETLQSLDRGIGAIVDALKTSGQIANTHVIFTSDNGFLEGEHRIANAKNYIYEPAARAPLYWLQPSGYAETCYHPLSNLDVTAAIAELSGAAPQRILDGTSLVPLLSDASAPWNKAVLIQSSQAIGIATYYYRYIEWFCGDVELYDMKADRDQLNNVANDERYAEVRTACAEALLALRGCQGSSCAWTGKFPPPP
jgi:arylsulfatase A-like enzyme